MRTLGRMADVLFDFLEDAGVAGGAALAAARALGCFLAQAPGALRPRLLRLLPALVGVTNGDGVTDGVDCALAFLLPALLQASDGEEAAAEGEAAAEAAAEAADALVAAGGVEALCALVQRAGGTDGVTNGEAALGVLRNLAWRARDAGAREHDSAALRAAAAARAALESPSLARAARAAAGWCAQGELGAAIAAQPPSEGGLADWLLQLPV